MSWELPQAVVDWAQVLGAFLSLVALVVALLALYIERLNATAERRKQHELQLLRDIGDQLIVENVDKRALGTRLRTLPPSRDFPLTRTALDIRPTDQEYSEFLRAFSGHFIREHPELSGTPEVERAVENEDARWQFVVHRDGAADSCILRQELDAAIDRRIRARRRI